MRYKYKYKFISLITRWFSMATLKKPNVDFILLILIRFHLDFFLFMFFFILSKPMTIFMVLLRLGVFFCRPLLSSSIYLSIFIIYLVRCFSYLYNLESNEASKEDDIYEKSKHKLYVISSGLVAGFVTYFILDKSVNFMGDKFIESGLVSEENTKMIREMQHVPFKCDVFCVSFCVGSLVAYLVSKKLSSN